jgi:cation diffusion facilitator CzcD-associated flavoprotein CzcO
MPSLANLGQFEGVGVYYSTTFMEAQLCGGDEVIVVGGGNSAGQAAVFLAQAASTAPAHNNSDGQIEVKLHTAQPALQMVEPGMTLRLGSGSTATLWIKLLGERVRGHG